MTDGEEFSALPGSREGNPLPLLAAAAQVPLYADPGCEPPRVLDQVQSWAAQLRLRLAPDASALARLRLLNHFFFVELGFAGAGDDYQSVDNSYLHRVIERRRGIPITLSLLYIELGRAAGLHLQGMSFPGHFLVRLSLHGGAVVIDVFGGGVTLSPEVLRERLRATLPEAADPPLAPYLQAASDREILARLLRNLKVIHWQKQQWAAALEVVNRLIAVAPEAAAERLDRAQLYEHLDCPRAAIADLETYLSLSGPAPGVADVRRRLARLQLAASRLH